MILDLALFKEEYDIKRRNTGIAAQHGEFSGRANGIHDEHGQIL